MHEDTIMCISASMMIVNLNAGFGWDGESAALGSCALGEAGDECRRNVLL